jgi:hypothetical protein
MKYYLKLTFLLLSITSFGQYDSIKKITRKIDPGLNELMIPGKWEELDKTNKNENLISHCTIYINENNTILEFAKWDSTILPLKNGYDIVKTNNNFLQNLENRKLEILSTGISPTKNYYLYKLKKKSIPSDELIIYYIIGVKKKNVLIAASYKYEKESECSFNYLIELFNNN